ncbi:MAG: hypothetical protein IJA15_00250 [Clostridia bacterium]|nr:hypothetical protein [Clostridia bacterium]
MKKILTAFLVLVMALSCFAFIGCKDQGDMQATLDMYIFDKDGQTVAEDFVLPGYIGQYKTTWTSDNEVIALEELAEDKEGGIERQYVAKVGLPEERTQVNLTVALSSSVKKTYTVYVNALSVYDFSGAYNFIKNNAMVVADFDLDTTCEFKGHTATIVWSVEEEYADYIEISEDGTKCIVYPTSLNPVVRINATFTYNGESTTKGYRMTVSEQKEPLQEVDFWYTNTGVGIVMSGYVVSIATAYDGDYGNVSLYMVNDEFTAGYYLYRVKSDEANAALLAPGVHITVTGTTNTNYNGLIETNAGGNLVVDGDIPAINVSEKVYAVDNDVLGNLQSAYYHQSRLVSLTNWAVKEVKGAPNLSSGTQTLFVLTKGGVDVPVVISKYQEGAYKYSTDDATCAALIALQGTLKEGDIVSVTGILGNYNGHQIAPQSAAAVVVGGTADAEGTVYAGQKAAKAVAAIDKLIADNGLDSIVAVAKNVALPVSVEGCEVAYRIIGAPRTISIVEGALVIAPGKMERACLTAEITVDGFTTNIFRYIEAADLDDAGKVALEKEEFALEVPAEVSKNTSVALPATGYLFDTIAVTWTLDGEAISDSVAFKLGDVEATYTLVGTLTLNNAVETVSYTVKVLAKTEDLAPGVVLNMGLVQGTLGKTLYVTGEVSGRYLATTDKVEEAADVYAEAVEGGYKFYIIGENDAKLYLDVYKNADGKDSVQFGAEGNVFAYDAVTKAWLTDHEGTEVYCGTYNNYNTVSASKSSYITAENTGVSQFPCFFVVDEAVAYNIKLEQAKLEKTLYVTGEVSGRYLATSEAVAEGAKVYIEKATDGYKFYIIGENDAKLYLDVYLNADKKDSVQFSAEGNIFAYKAEVNAWVTDHEGTDVYCGTYNTYNTVSASKSSYITAENTGVSQFPCILVVAPSDECEHSWTDATCEAPKTCSLCGATEGDALGHDFVENVCSRCGEVVITVSEAVKVEQGSSLHVKGVVVNADTWSTEYNNMSVTIADAASELYVYRLSTQVAIGDIIVVTGTMSSYNNAIQIAQGATAEIVGTHTHNFVEGKCDACTAKEAVGVELSFNDVDNRESWSEEQQVWKQNGIIFTNDKATSSSNVADYSAPARLYKNSSLTVALESGNMAKIVFTCNSASYATALQGSIAANDNYTVTVDGKDVIVTFTTAVESFEIAALSGGQVRMDKIQVVAA